LFAPPSSCASDGREILIIFFDVGERMVERIADGIYRIEVPLKGSPLRYTNSYLVMDGDEALLIDTGFNRESCYRSIKGALEELNVRNFRVFCTHMHADHMGLAAKLADEVLMGETEAKIVRETMVEEDYWRDLLKFYIKNGFPAKEAEKILSLHPGRNFWVKDDVEFVAVGEVVRVGSFRLKAIETPGHSPGHTCLYDESRKIFFSGDHVLIDITPNITWWPFLEDSLSSYLQSLEKVENLDVKLVLPGHRRRWNDLKTRVEEIKKHHSKRLREALSALNTPKTAWEVAPSITWDLVYTKWADVHVVQKWFAVGETIAHLEHLYHKGLVGKKEENGEIRYFRVS